MKISNVTILSTNLTNNTAKISFTISEATENVSIYLKINDEEYKEIFSNKTNEDLEYTANISRGINNLLLKATDSTTEYITEPIQVLLKEAPTIENLECSYSDSTGKYILNFAFNGDTNFKYSIYLKLDTNDYIEVLSNQISGDKTIEQTSTMGNHTCILKVSDGYDEYTFSSYQFEITNRKPILSKVLVTDITNNGEAYIYYSTKDIESSTLTHKLTIGTTETVITPTQVDNFYSYRITGLSEGISNCMISISDGIDVVSSDVFSIEVFSDTTDKKELLRRAKVRYDSAYQQLRDIIVSVISDLKYDYDIENALIAKAQDNYKIEYSNFNKISQQSIDTIGSNKVKVTKQELQSEINDVDSAVNSLETTMWGVFQDGILDQSERDTLSGSLDLVAKEKIDIDKDYEVLYNNEDLLDPSKTKLQTNYNNFIEAHNSLVTTINNIINKEGIIDNTDKANMDTAFENWRTSLGNYRIASLEAIDSIAKKKADDSADVVDKKWAEIVLDPETGIKSQVGSLQSKITGAGGIEERLKTAEQTITTDGISNIVKDVYYTKTEIDNKVTNVDNKIKVTVKSVNVMYYLSTSTTELIGGTWSDVAPTWEANKYMWSKTVITLSDGTIKESSPTCIAGAKGQDGVPGKDGKTTYTWIKYADDENGNGISNDPTNKSYIGFAYNKTTNIESNSPSDYTWSLIKGTDGVDGQDGKDGKDGTSVTILGSYDSVGELNQAHPNNNNNGDGYIINGDLYLWDGKSFINVGQIKGEDGKNGVDGQDGKNGLNAYVHIKYSNDGGKTFTPSNGEEVGDYLGVYTDYYEADSTDVTKYTWSKIKGQDGVNGTTYYTWIKYSDNEDGSNMYDTPTDNTKYIGIAVNKTTPTESNVASDYKWSKFRGEDGAKGADGVPGTNGKDGVTTYTWIKYADDSNGNGISNNPTGKEYIGFAYNKTTATESNVPSDYMWSLIKGADGINGTNGVDGVTYYTWIKYSDNADGTGLYNTPNSQTKYIGIATNKTTATESTNKTDYVWSLFRGENGSDGTGIESITEEYYLSTSKTTQTGGSWVTTPPTWEYGKYIWIRSKIVYKDPASTVYTTPICDSSWEAVNEIEIGGRNLVLNSDVLDSRFEALGGYQGTRTVVEDNEAKSKKHLEFKCTAAGVGFYFPIFSKSSDKIGKTYTWSFWAKCSVAKSGHVGHESGGRVNINLTTEWQKFTHTWVFTDDQFYSFTWYMDWNVGEILYVRDFKIEEGNKATDWSPAPEDVQAQIDNNKTEIETTKTTVASHTTSLNSITSRVETNEANITTVNGEITNMEKRVSTAEQKITDKAITSVVQESQFIKDMDGKISTNKSNISKVEQTVDSWEVEIGNKADSSNIISIINASTEGITISSSKVNISGFVTFSDLSTSGRTTINGANITTGYISGDRIKGGKITATKEINFEGGARMFGNDGEFESGLAISAGGFNFSGGSVNYLSGNWYLIDAGNFNVSDGNISAGGNITAGGNIKGTSFSCNGPCSLNENVSVSGTAWLNGVYISGSTTAKGLSCSSFSVSGDAGVSGHLNVYGNIYGMNNIALSRGSLYAPVGSATRDYLRFGTHLLSSDPSYGVILTSSSGDWTTVRCGTVIANGTTLSSDKRLKTDIKYINLDAQTIGENGLEAPNVNITTEDMHTFIETLPIASYRLKSDIKVDLDKTYYGFIAQDILYSKVGSELIEYDVIELEPPVIDEEGNITKDGVYDDKGLRYSENKFITFICGALQEEIRQRKALERRLNNLMDTINK